jgi:Pyruvate/2-oxoacid:ferredoxin oxidoreductase delta subunit
VCLIVGSRSLFVHEHHPERSRRISQMRRSILRRRRARHVHHAFFKDAILGRFYAICNCCDCCCGAMQAQRRGTPMLISSGYTCRVNESVCIGCGECGGFCQFHALSLGNGHSVVDFDKCMGCGVCASKCAQGALALERAPEKGEPLELFDIAEKTIQG